MTRRLLTLILISWSLVAGAQEKLSRNEQGVRPFLALELGEALFNNFQSYSGEAGLRFKNNHLLRLTHMNVKLTEKHLSSSFAGAVNGPNVEGSFFGFEAFFDFPVLWNKLYLAPSIGYYKNKYDHTIVDAGTANKSATIGLGISFRETDLFGVKGFYYSISVPMRIALDPAEKVVLGETTIINGAFDNNIWLFIGFEF